jgi:adenylate kinase
MLNIFKKEGTINSSPIACVFIGRSGCGKGTQVELFKKELEKRTGMNILHVETGSFLRNLVKGNTYTGELTKKIIETGSLMPESIVIGLWVSYLINNYTGKENFIFDGAPRRLAEAELLDGALNFFGIPDYKVVYINTSVKWCTDRLLARGRKDDTQEGINKRMEWFDKDVLPCVEYFSKDKNCQVFEINGERTIEEVHADIMSKVFGK